MKKLILIYLMIITLYTHKTLANCEQLIKAIKNNNPNQVFSYSYQIYHHIIRHDQNFTCLDEYGNNLWHLYASYAQDEKIFSSLTNFIKPDINEINHLGQTPLICAALSSNYHAAYKFLMSFQSAQQKIQINKRDRFGRTALHYAVIAKNINLTTLLINFGANKDIADRENQTARDLARQILANSDNYDIISVSHNGNIQ